MNRRVTYLILLIAVLSLLVACGGDTTPAAEPEEAPVETGSEGVEEPQGAVTNAVTVVDQALGNGNTITVGSVTSDGPGWLVVHAQAGGGPGPVIGQAAVQAGENRDVAVEIDPAAATSTLYAMLHVDAGTVGEYEFPGDDVPATGADGNVVTPSFELALATVRLGGNDTLGEFLVDARGMTLYLYTEDFPGVSNCYDGCAAAWPPLLVADGETPTLGDRIPGELATTERTDGSLQVTYNGMPLYLWVSDTQPGDATGQGVNDVWFVLEPGMENILAGPTAATVALGGNDELGEFLVGANGMTLYLFTRDEPGVSTCYDGCAAAWPPLLVEAGESLVLGEGIPGELATTERTDGTLQVTYNDLPLYFWASDTEPGDATGQGVNDVWFVIEPGQEGFGDTAALMPTLMLGSNDELGDFLVGGNGMTLYLFTRDEPGVSNCVDGCAAAWPPLLVSDAEELVAADGISGVLGAIERDDGTLQVTYNDIPLYFWASDAEPGDTTGHGVNDVWYVVDPALESLVDAIGQPTVIVGSTDELGEFLVDANGMTLYLFTTDEPGVSTCYDGCAVAWPPLLVEEGETPRATDERIGGELGVTSRDDGTLQVTYNDIPLYYWANDSEPGDTTGHGVGNVWFVVEP